MNTSNNTTSNVYLPLTDLQEELVHYSVSVQVSTLFKVAFGTSFDSNEGLDKVFQSNSGTLTGSLGDDFSTIEKREQVASSVNPLDEDHVYATLTSSKGGLVLLTHKLVIEEIKQLILFIAFPQKIKLSPKLHPNVIIF